jgi:hypothetical protein
VLSPGRISSSSLKATTAFLAAVKKFVRNAGTTKQKNMVGTSLRRLTVHQDVVVAPALGRLPPPTHEVGFRKA